MRKFVLLIFTVLCVYQIGFAELDKFDIWSGIQKGQKDMVPDCKVILDSPQAKEEILHTAYFHFVSGRIGEERLGWIKKDKKLSVLKRESEATNLDGKKIPHLIQVFKNNEMSITLDTVDTQISQQYLRPGVQGTLLISSNSAATQETYNVIGICYGDQ